MDEYVDGNAIVGAVSLALGKDASLAWVTCSGCNDYHELARTRVYRRAPGMVVRCPNCDGVELLITEIRKQLRVNMPGISVFELTPR